MYLYLIICLDVSSRNTSEGANLLDLSSHGKAEKSEEVDKQNWPVDRDVGRAGDSAEEGDSVGFGSRIPELELCSSAQTPRV